MALSVALLMLGTTPTAAALRVEVDKPFQPEPGTITLTITLPTERGDTLVCYGWVRYWTYRYRDGRLEAREDSHRSCQPLQGQYNLKWHRPQFRRLQWGEYVAFVQVYKQGQNLADRASAVSTVGFLVTGIGDTP